ncbi:MAG: flagellar motor protein MotB [Lachnospiraceae bacterium]|nr:flagellar motor protein MotB [Lachnospiraceae bacterium]
MAREKKKEEEIKTDLWKDTFSDLMNLLLCFFVLLYSMSTVDEVKYAELVASLSNSFSIFSGGAQAIGEGQLISSGATQLNNLDEYYSDMGKAAEENDVEEDPLAELEKQRKQDTEELYSDVVEKTENNRIEDSVDITMDDNYQYVMISLSGGILFDSGSAEIRSGAKPILSRVGYILKNYPDRRIKIEGHTDNVPISTAEYPSNLWLSTARATKVLEFFTSKKGLNEKNMEASGRGDVDPVADNSTAGGRAKNRRVEIKIYSDID